MLGTPEYRVPGLTFGAPYNYPQTLNQNNWTGRADFSIHKDKHDLKSAPSTSTCTTAARGSSSAPGSSRSTARRPTWRRCCPPGQELNPGAWNLAPLNPLARDYQVNFARNESDWTIDVPRPTYAIWMGDNWRVRSDLTINLGIRWDADPNQASPPNIVTNNIIINSGIPASYNHQLAGTNDYGYKTDIRDWKNIAPRGASPTTSAGRTIS
jgi:hypothetical protein